LLYQKLDKNEIGFLEDYGIIIAFETWTLVAVAQLWSVRLNSEYDTWDSGNLCVKPLTR
jgi:hypothetical protein